MLQRSVECNRNHDMQSIAFSTGLLYLASVKFRRYSISCDNALPHALCQRKPICELVELFRQFNESHAAQLQCCLLYTNHCVVSQLNSTMSLPAVYTGWTHGWMDEVFHIDLQCCVAQLLHAANHWTDPWTDSV